MDKPHCSRLPINPQFNIGGMARIVTPLYASIAARPKTSLWAFKWTFNENCQGQPTGAFSQLQWEHSGGGMMIAQYSVNTLIASFGFGWLIECELESNNHSKTIQWLPYCELSPHRVSLLQCSWGLEVDLSLHCTATKCWTLIHW